MVLPRLRAMGGSGATRASGRRLASFLLRSTAGFTEVAKALLDELAGKGAPREKGKTFQVISKAIRARLSAALGLEIDGALSV